MTALSAKDPLLTLASSKAEQARRPWDEAAVHEEYEVWKAKHGDEADIGGTEYMKLLEFVRVKEEESSGSMTTKALNAQIRSARRRLTDLVSAQNTLP